MTYACEPLPWTRNLFPLGKFPKVVHILFLYPGRWKLRHFAENTPTRPSAHGRFSGKTEHRGVTLEQKFGVIYVYAANDGNPGVIFWALGCGDWSRNLLHAAQYRDDILARALWCSALSCGLQVNCVALSWTMGFSLKGETLKKRRLQSRAQSTAT